MAEANYEIASWFKKKIKAALEKEETFSSQVHHREKTMLHLEIFQPYLPVIFHESLSD